MQYLIYGLFCYILLQSIVYIVLFDKFARLTFQYPRYIIKNHQTIPKYLVNFAHLHTKQLTNLGFIFCEYLEIETTVVGDGCVALLFHNQACDTYAIAKIYAICNQSIPIDYSFKTFFDDGILLITINGFYNSVIGELPNTILEAPCVNNVEQQFQIHQAKIANLLTHKKTKILPIKSFVRALTVHETDYVNNLYYTHKIIKTPKTNVFKLTVKAILQTIYKCQYKNPIKTNIIDSQNQKILYKQVVSNSVPAELEVNLFKKWQIRETRQANNYNYLIKVGILLTSLVLFILAAKLYFDWRSLCWLIGILLLHELGHLTAMKIYGYSNISIFFLPFFGAAVSGTKDNATLTEKIIVLLSGSVPGIVLGLFLILTIPHTLYTIANFHLIIKWLIGLNCLNLLPIFPLDGGKIINLLFFSVYPYGEAIFKIFTIILLVTTSIIWQEPILFSLAILLLISTPRSWKIARTAQYLSTSTSSKCRTDKRLLDIFQAIARARYQNLQLDTKFRLAQEILKQQQQPSASWCHKLCLILTYLGFLIAGIWAMKIA